MLAIRSDDDLNELASQATRLGILGVLTKVTYWQNLQGPQFGVCGQNFHPSVVLTPRSFLSARTGGLLS